MVPKVPLRELTPALPVPGGAACPGWWGPLFLAGHTDSRVLSKESPVGHDARQRGSRQRARPREGQRSPRWAQRVCERVGVTRVGLEEVGEGPPGCEARGQPRGEKEAVGWGGLVRLVCSALRDGTQRRCPLGPRESLWPSSVSVKGRPPWSRRAE